MKYDCRIPVSLPDLVKDYLNASEQVRSFHTFSPSLQGLTDAADSRRQHPVDRAVLVEVLMEQAADSDTATDAVRANIQLLAQPESYTVCTGHQLVLFGGPMFFLYKIMSVIRLSEKLKRQGIQAVPVYWMATEDHDFEEINHFYLSGKKLLWLCEAAGPVGMMHCQQLESIVDNLREALGNDSRYVDALERLRHFFRPERTLAQAVRDFVYWVFGAYGVVVIDAADKRLKKALVPIVERELREGFSFKALQKTTDQLVANGYKPQVTGREVNLFWMEAGYRERIVRVGAGFATADGRLEWSPETLLEELHTRPECFSPNVILRPLYQEVILPNIAYVGGPGELSYWLQLKEVFHEAKHELPVLLLRDQALIMDVKSQKRMLQLGLQPADLQELREVLFERLVRASGTHEHLVDEARNAVEPALTELREAIAAWNPDLGTSAAAELTRIQNRLEVLRKKVFRADKRTHAIAEARLDELEMAVRPHGEPQERVQNWMTFTPDPKVLVESMLEAFDPLQIGMKCFRE